MAVARFSRDMEPVSLSHQYVLPRRRLSHNGYGIMLASSIMLSSGIMLASGKMLSSGIMLASGLLGERKTEQGQSERTSSRQSARKKGPKKSPVLLRSAA